jgi:hypothetical protein
LRAALFQPMPDALQCLGYVGRGRIQIAQISDQTQIGGRACGLETLRQPLLALGKLSIYVLSTKWGLMLGHSASFLLFFIE